MRKIHATLNFDWLDIFYRANQISCNISNPYLTSLWERSISRQRNSSRESVYAKYVWLHINNSIEFSLHEKIFRFTSELNWCLSQSTLVSTAMYLSFLYVCMVNTIYLLSFVETPRKFIIAELLIRKLGSTSMLIILLALLLVLMKIRAYGSKALQ